MIREGHLSVYDLTLTTRAPLFVGSGTAIKKTDYLFDHARSRITVLDTKRLLTYLVEHNLADLYESFILSGQTNMYTFLRKICGLPQAIIDELSLYQLDIAGTLDDLHSLKEILQLSRTADNRVYVSGGSVKGALRTALLLHSAETAVPGQDEHLHRRYTFRENSFTNTLQFQSARPFSAANAATSVLQGIRISDSSPIENSSVILAAKADGLPDGSVNLLNVLWECIAPETQLHFKLTLDHTVLDHCSFQGQTGISIDTIRQAIGDFAVFYRQNFEAKFQKPAAYQHQTCTLPLLLGGNTGYFSKTLAYPYWGERAQAEVSAFLQGVFPKHKCELDEKYQIAPHTIRYACCNGLLYPMGLCEVSIT